MSQSRIPIYQPPTPRPAPPTFSKDAFSAPHRLAAHSLGCGLLCPSLALSPPATHLLWVVANHILELN